MGLKASIKQYGIFNSFKRLLKLIARKFGVKSEKFLYCTQAIDINSLNPSKLKVAEDIRELSLNIIKTSKKIEFSSEKINLFKKRFNDKNYKGYGFFINGELVYYTWISLLKFEMSVSSPDIHLDCNEGLLIDSFCHPDFRGYAIHSHMNNFRLKKILENKKNHAVAIVLKENIPARKTQKKSGFKCNKVINYYKIWNWENISVSSKQINL